MKVFTGMFFFHWVFTQIDSSFRERSFCLLENVMNLLSPSMRPVWDFVVEVVSSRVCNGSLHCS